MKKLLALVLVLIVLCSCTETDTPLTEPYKSDASDTVCDIDTQGVTETGTDINTEAGAPSTQAPDYVSELGFGELSESELESMYNNADAAEKNGEAEYAHAVFAMLARRGYRDASDRERSLIRSARANVLIYDELECFIGSENGSAFSFECDSDFLDSAYGYLYIAAGGEPMLAYKYGGGVEIRAIDKDRAKKNVVSMAYTSLQDISGNTPVIQCLKSDGSVCLIYNKNFRSDNSDKAEITALEKFTSELKDVVMISVCYKSYETMYLHSDGTVSVFSYVHRNDAQTEALGRVAEWKDIVDITYNCAYAIGLMSDGTLLRETIGSRAQTEDESALDLSDYKVQLITSGCLTDGVLLDTYSGTPMSYVTFTDGETEQTEKYRSIVYKNGFYAIDADKNIIPSSPYYAIDQKTVDGIAYLGSFYCVTTDGDVLPFAYALDTIKDADLIERIKISK